MATSPLSALVSRPRDSHHNSRAGHPAWRRCSSLTNPRFARSSRLASRAPRSGTHATNYADGTLVDAAPVSTGIAGLDHRLLGGLTPNRMTTWPAATGVLTGVPRYVGEDRGLLHGQ